MRSLTELQESILHFIRSSIEDNGFPPAIREIGRRFGISATSSVAYHLRVLEKRGYLKRTSSLSRGIQLVEDPFRLPILGRVGAGSGHIAEEDVEGSVCLGKDIAGKADFLLRVCGDSMDRAGILEDDLVQVRRQETAVDGQIVVALVGEEGVVKTLKEHGGRWRLESANPAYPPITAEFRVIGRVVGLLRAYGKRRGARGWHGGKP